MYRKIIYIIVLIIILISLSFFIKNQFEYQNSEALIHIDEDKSVQNIVSKPSDLIEGFKETIDIDMEKAVEIPKESHYPPEIINELQRILNTSSEGLIEIKTDKGEMVDLKDRFRTAPVATINEKGEVVIQDYISPPNN